MLAQRKINGGIRGHAEVLSGEILSLEKATNETGASTIEISTSEHVEATLLNAVAALRRTRNSLRPVNKLPPELLSHIFSLVPGPARGHGSLGWTPDFGPHAIAPVVDLLPLLAVCSRWRSVATSSSFLWSTIDNRNQHAFSISSGYRPVRGFLDVHISRTSLLHGSSIPRQPFELDTSFLDLLLHDGHRVRELFADVPAVFLRVLMQLSGESLQRCILFLTESDDVDSVRAGGPLFRGCTPKLKSLIIKNVLIIPSNDFPSLTHLILECAGFHLYEFPYAFSDILQFLSRCPNLEVLHLFALDAGHFRDLPDGRVAAPVALRCLRKFSNEEVVFDRTRDYPLEYSGPGFRRAILEHLQLSPDCLVRLSTILPDDLARTLRSLPFDKPLTSVYLTGYDASSSLVNGNHLEWECFALMATDPSRHRGVRIDFQMPGMRYGSRPAAAALDGAREVVRDAIRTAPLLEGVNELWVTPPANVLLGEPHSLLEAFPSLTTLVLGLSVVPITPPSTVPGNAVRHQEPLSALEVRNDDPVVPCPKLHTLCVYVAAEEHVMQLYATLLSRGEAGHPVRRLVVGFYRPPEHAVLELATGLAGLIEDFTLLRPTDPCPEDLLWVHRLPFVCRDSSERNLYWPAWS
ncbi:hypothetical protein GSI_04960 [Ganoderma sinense ZZ0214-1]|uniref:F-box domain-containing protein n=1 Tax=Ganoderma sinense ZZ0214-1 TaxID=1077348 RepID=A0A2G8SGF9_9APHY|nr:hypothetical protein GSI_04960 [Ganoderma sinense ZZ0214-1]